MQPARPPRSLLVLALVLAAGGVRSLPAFAQDLPPSPVFVDDSTAAADALASIDALVSVGNQREAVRALQRALETEAERLLPSADDLELFVPVRDRVHARLLADADLLARYRELTEPDAAAALAAGADHRVERSMLLTPSGFDAALRVAQGLLTDARFDAAYRVLSQLDAHPDRVGDNAARAATLLRLTASYTDHPGLAAMVGRWAASGEGASLPQRIAAPQPPGGIERRSIDGGVTSTAVGPDAPAPIDLSTLTDEPLASARLTEDAPDLDPAERARRERALEMARSAAPSSPWTLPTAVGDVVYLNDGITVRAVDRYTLRTIWQVRTDADDPEEESWASLNRRRLGRTIEDSSTVAMLGDTLLAVTGQPAFGSREGDGRLHAIDAGTGVVRWSLDPALLDPALADGSVRGPVLVADGSAVVAVRKSVRARRLAALHLVSLDPATGAPNWIRGIGSAGALPFQAFGRPSGALTLHRGVVFACDELGVLGAVDAATGRPLWVRRMNARTPLNADRAGVFGTPAPLIDGETAIALSPAGDELLRVELATGRILSRRAAASFGSADYMLRVGDDLAIVGRDSVAFVPIGRFESAQPRIASLAVGGAAPSRTGRGGLVLARGRAAVAGSRVLVPIDGGVVEIDPARPDAAVFHALSAVGTLLALPGQLLAVDELDVHSFLSWEIASAQLERRLRDTPQDAAPAVTLAELAARVGRSERIVPALDAAAAALDAADDQALRDALFASMLAIVRRSLAPDDAPPAAGAPRVADGRVVEQIVARLGTLARTVPQRLEHLLALGELRESVGDGRGAAEAYRAILADPELASAESRGSRVTISASREAARRVERVATTLGWASLALWEAQAAAEIAAGGGADSLDGGEAAALLLRHPLCSAAPALWSRVGAARLAEDRPQSAARAWRSGVRAAEAIRAAGGPVDLNAVGPMVTRLARSLAESGRTADARRELTRAVEAFGPALATAAADPAIDPVALAERAGETLPAVGPGFAPDAAPALVAGSPAAPLDGVADRHAALFVRPGEARLAFVALDDPSAPRDLWTAPIEGSLAPVVLSVSERIELLRPPEGVDDPARLEALSRDDGSLVWRAEALTEALASRGVVPGLLGEAGGAAEEGASERAVVVTIDPFTTVLLERRGTAAAFDRRTGRTLWARDLGAGTVADAILADGVLAVAAGGGPDRDGRAAGRTVVCLDARTGEELHRLDRLGSAARMLRASGAGDLLVFSDASVLSLSLSEAEVNWSAPLPGGAEDCWVLGDDAVVLGGDRRLRRLGLRSGLLQESALDDRLRAGMGGVVSTAMAGERLVVVTGAGVLLYDEEGRLVGLDAVDRPTGGPIAAAVVSGGGVVTLDDPVEAGSFRLGRLSDTGLLLADTPLIVPAALGLRAQSLTAVDGAVVVGFGAVSAVVRMPEAPGP